MRYIFTLLITTSLFQCFSQAELPSLDQFVGYYDVGVKPNKPFFKSRWYLRDGRLFTIYDSDIDRELVPYENGELKPTIFFSEDEVEVTDTDSTYYLVLNFKNNQLENFRVIRPRKIWPTDLYGYRNERLDELAVDTEKELILTKKTERFIIHYTALDTATVNEISNVIETNYQKALSYFELEEFPTTTIRIYPDLETYHNAVLTPGAPQWQMGRAWDNNEIRMLSPVESRRIIGETSNPGELVLHEFVHCLHLASIPDAQRVPGWLWEGLAMYIGCCEWIDSPFELEYMKEGEYPTIKQIEQDRTYQKKYELGYYFIEFLEKEYGWEKILELVKNNGNIKKALDISTRQFEKSFYAYLSATYN